MKQFRVAFLNTHPIQYFAPLYSYLNSCGRFDITALYLTNSSIRGGLDKGFGQTISWNIDLLKGYRSHFTKHSGRRELGGFLSAVAPDLWKHIRKERYDAIVIHGHNFAAHHVAVAAALSVGTRVLTRGETHLRLKRSLWRSAIRTPLLRRWYKLLDGCLAIGTANTEYYAQMGVPAKNIFLTPYSVDNERFINGSNLAKAECDGMRRKLGIQTQAPIILYSGKFDVRKHPDHLLRAFAKLKRKGLDAELVMAGSGHMQDRLAQLTEELGLTQVHFPGFINQAELPSLYAIADIFVLPSENEPWGLAINEAMCGRTAIVASSEVGCVADLVRDGENGKLFPAGNIDALADALELLLSDQTFLDRAKEHSREIVSKWDFAAVARGLEEALKTSQDEEPL